MRGSKKRNLTPSDLSLPYVFSRGYCYFFEPSPRQSSTYFGGPSEFAVFGAKHGPAQLHHIMHLGQQEIPAIDWIIGLPLFYGIQFDGCRLEYRMTGRGCAVTRMRPRKSTKAWPYAGYPPLLPFVPMQVARRERMTAAQLRKLLWQDIELDELVCVVPPIVQFGHSLWGPGGDAEDVLIVFECDIAKRTVRATNQCT